MPVPMMVANWKMHQTAAGTREFMQDFLPRVSDCNGVDILVCPTALHIVAATDAARGCNVGIGAQNVHPEPSGAFTGEIAAPMLQELGVRACIVGHSERRELFGETDEFIARKIRTLQQFGMTPILCVGETLEQREQGIDQQIVLQQLDVALANADLEHLVVAYEPVWAIGTGRSATPEDAQLMHACIRKAIAGMSARAADSLQILYGGSVKPQNAADLLAQPDIDGALVGGASLQPESFAQLCVSTQE